MPQLSAFNSARLLRGVAGGVCCVVGGKKDVVGKKQKERIGLGQAGNQASEQSRDRVLGGKEKREGVGVGVGGGLGGRQGAPIF